MISAQNRLPRSNGNRLFLLSIVAILCLGACVPKKKYVKTTQTSKKNKPTPKEDQETKPTKKVTEIEWTIADESEFPPIGSKKVVNVTKQGSYQISLLIPFNSSSANSNNLIEKGTAENRFVEFYAGMKMALEEHQGSTPVSINVHDSGGKDADQILNLPGLASADVIIGPYEKSSIKEVAYLAKENESVLISPWQASKKIAEKNPHYVQMKPNLEDHYYAIAEDVCQNFSADQVYIIGRNNNTDKSRFKYFQNTAQARLGNRFNEYIISEDSLNYGETAYDTTFFERDIAFIIPNWKSSDENFVYSCMRKLRVEKKVNKVTVYGMPIVAESDKMNYDLYLNLNTHVAISRFFDKTASAIKSFRNRYYGMYNTLPTKDACEGYDVAKYVLKNLELNGSNFQYFLENDDEQYLLSKFNVERYLVNIEEDRNNPKNIEYFLNNEVQLIHFSQGKFRVKP